MPQVTQSAMSLKKGLLYCFFEDIDEEIRLIQAKRKTVLHTV
jgi:hypothetical protein